jgi:hypothetical protein
MILYKAGINTGNHTILAALFENKNGAGKLALYMPAARTKKWLCTCPHTTVGLEDIDL